MGRQRYVYRQREDGKYVACLVRGQVESRKDIDPENMSFHQRVLRAYHEVDCNGGYRGAYPKGVVRRLHEDAIARGE